MLRKTLAALLLIAAFAAASGVMPGVLNSITYACDLESGVGC